MREIILAERGIVFLQTADALRPGRDVLVERGHVGGHGLDLPTVFLPFLERAFLFREVHTAFCLEACAGSHLLHEETVLVLVDGLDEFRCNVGVKRPVVLQPFVESHENLYGIHHVGRLVQLFNS